MPGQVGAAGGRRAEHHAHGRDPLGRELGEPPELLAAGDEDVGLAGQIGPSGLDQQHQGKAVLLGHVHGPQQLADGGGAGRPAAHGGVVGDDEALGVGDLDQGHDDAAADRITGVQPGQRRELEHGRARIDQCFDALAHHHLAAGPMTFDVLARRHRPAPRRAGCAPRRPARPWRSRWPSNSSLADREPRPDRRAHGVVSHSGRRFSKKAAMPSVASGSGEEFGRRRRGGRQPVGPALRRQRAQQFLGGADRARRGLAQGQWSARPPRRRGRRRPRPRRRAGRRRRPGARRSARRSAPCGPGSDGP